jgi:hypothetical protein
VAVSPHIEELNRVFCGDQLGDDDPTRLLFRDPNSFYAGELHQHSEQWELIVGEQPTPRQEQVLKWIREKVSIFPYF